MTATSRSVEEGGASDHMMKHHSVVIIGAGLAGLQAARELKAHFADLLVLEASCAPGGRIKQLRNLADWPVEAGPEFVHGGNALLKAHLEEMGCQLRELAWPDQWWWQESGAVPGRLMQGSEPDPDLEWLHNVFEEVGNEEMPQVDISAEQWLRDKGATSRALAAADACYANDFGCGLGQLGLRELIAENRAWDAGESYLILDRSLSHLADHLAKPLGTSLRCDWPVKRLMWGCSKGRTTAEKAAVTLEGPSGQTITCDRVLITVPLLSLQSGGIIFEPPLPPRKAEAIQRLRMGAAVKLLLGFRTAVWPERFWDAVCPGAFLPEVWVTSYPTASSAPGEYMVLTAGDPVVSSLVTAEEAAAAAACETAGRGNDSASMYTCTPPTSAAEGTTPVTLSTQSALNGSDRNSSFVPRGARDQRRSSSKHSRHTPPAAYVVTGFATGPAAEAIAALPPAVAVYRAIRQLDAMFGTPAEPRPATLAFSKGAVVDWAAQPYIGGGYTYPTLGAHSGDRKALAAPISGVMYWAGEATHPAVNPCMQAALETGQTAAAQIIAAARQPKSSL